MKIRSGDECAVALMDQCSGTRTMVRRAGRCSVQVSESPFGREERLRLKLK